MQYIGTPSVIYFSCNVFIVFSVTAQQLNPQLFTNQLGLAAAAAQQFAVPQAAVQLAGPVRNSVSFDDDHSAVCL